MLAWQLTGKTMAGEKSIQSEETDHGNEYHQPEDHWDH
jgi:hypothetical protein